MTSTVAYVAPNFVTSATLSQLTSFVFISTAFVNLITFVNSELTSFFQQYQPFMSLQTTFVAADYFCQQGPTTFVNRNFMILPMCTMLSHTLI